MSTFYTLSLDARRRALLTSSYSPRLSDTSQFPVSAILAKLPPLPFSPTLDVPELVLPAPPTPQTPDIAPIPVPITGTGGPAVNGLGLGIDYDNDLPQASGSGSDSGGLQPQAGPSGDLRPAFKTQPLDDLATSDNDTGGSSDSGKKKRYLGSRTIAWWTRFPKRG